MGDWKECKLGQIYEFASGLSKSRDEFGFGYGFLSFKDVFHNYFVPDKLVELVNATENERRRCSIKKGDVFLTRTSETQEELGMSCVALKDYPDATFNGFTKRLRPKDQKEVVPEFSGFYFRSPRFRVEVTSMASITTRASLNNSMLADLTIILPPLPEQKAIASVLSSLDDKIDLLQRQNKTLEAMAETLFRQRFVEEAQEGWEIGALGDFVNIAYGKNLPTKNLQNDGYPVFGGNGQIGFFERYLYKDPQVLVSCRGEASGVVNISLPKSFVTNNSLILEINKRKELTFEFLKYFALNTDFKMYISGSAQPQITINGLYGADFILPHIELIDRFSEIVRNWESKRTNNQTQIRTLEKLRDTLLPKLMSGDIRVSYDKN